MPIKIAVDVATVKRWSGEWSYWISMEYFYMPSMLIANLIILFVIAFPLVSWTVRKIAAPEQTMRRNMMNFAGLVLLLSISAWTVLLVQSGLYRIAVSTFASDYETYSLFRPV